VDAEDYSVSDPDRGAFTGAFGQPPGAAPRPGSGSGPSPGPALAPPGVGPAQAALDASLARVAIIFRSSWTVAVPVLTVLQFADGPSALQATLVAVTLGVWGFVFAATLYRNGLDEIGKLTIVADAMVFGACLALADQILPYGLVGDNTTWLSGGASIAIFMVSWVCRPLWTVAISGFLGLAYLVGVGRSGSAFQALHFEQVFIFVLQGCLAVAIVRVMRRGAENAGASLVHLERARAGLSVERARLRNRRGLERTLHDTVLSTLTAVARGGLADRPEAVRARCARDLARLEEIDGEPGPPLPAGTGQADLADLRARIALEVECSALTVEVRHHVSAEEPGGPDPADYRLPDRVATALVGAVGEALSNVERHAGVNEAEIEVWTGPDGACISISDAGRGFDPGRVRSDATGLRRSVHDRLTAVGGVAAVESAPNKGTLVLLRWSLDEAPGLIDPDASTSDRLRFVTDDAQSDAGGPAAQPSTAAAPGMLSQASTVGLTKALVVIALVWHSFCGVVMLILHDSYRIFPAELAAWIVIVAVVIVAARRPAERQTPVFVLGGQTVVFIAAVVAIVMVPGRDQIGVANWVPGDIGWPLAVLAIHRPLREYLVWNAGVIAVFLATVILTPGLGMSGVGKAAGVMLCALVLQVGTLVAHGVLRRDNARAEETVREITSVAVSRETLIAAAKERERWRREIGASLRPLVRSLADGTADPSDRHIRSRCAIEASRLRAAITALGESGEHSIWWRSVVEALTRAAHARGATLEVRITPEFGGVADEVRGELVNTALATLPMCGPGAAVVTLTGPVPGGDSMAAVTVLFTLPPDGDAVRRAVDAMLQRVRAALPHAGTDVEEFGDGRLWLEVRCPV
jgi:signal transduction histidine kinase